MPVSWLYCSSLDNELRNWVEQALHAEALKVVVCTSSPVWVSISDPLMPPIQVGSPKGVARFMRRAGRSGHHPGVYQSFVPTAFVRTAGKCRAKEAIKRVAFLKAATMLLPWMC